MKKRVSCRAILLDKDQLVVMHRIREDREYYTFPGGGVEAGETLQDCVKREVLEEFGLEISVEKCVYEYHSTTSLQYFFLCHLEGGVFGTGTGPEMVHPCKNKGQYLPEKIPIAQLAQLPLEPRILVERFLVDYAQFGKALSNEIQLLEDVTY